MARSFNKRLNKQIDSCEINDNPLFSILVNILMTKLEVDGVTQHNPLDTIDMLTVSPIKKDKDKQN